ncbi:hypothetical protein ACSFA2_15865 [Variovorax sp. LT2P21]|uniref:hypothetical protein n=1 Tax=Variovorax sp. LT2P21 TaxID=3443731 RepID=UPI003F45217F
MDPSITPEDRDLRPSVGARRARWLDESLDLLYIAFAVLGVSCAVGMVYGWLAGLAALAGAVIAVYGLLHLIRSVAHRSLQTRVPQRRFPGARR